MNSLLKLCAAAFISMSAPILAFAQSDAPTNDTDPVLVFNRVCYAQVPVLDNIRQLAQQQAWKPMAGEDLQQFTTSENTAVLEGWDVKITQRLYRLGIVQDSVSGNFKENFPDFSDGTVTSCSLVLDGRDSAEIILERMVTLAQKDPVSTNVPDGDLLTTTWAGGNEDFKVFLFLKTDAKGNANLLNVTILSKAET